MHQSAGRTVLLLFITSLFAITLGGCPSPVAVGNPSGSTVGDGIPPEVTSFDVNTFEDESGRSVFKVSFSQPVDSASAPESLTFTPDTGVPLVSGTTASWEWKADNTEAEITLDPGLIEECNYTAELSSALTDLSGEPLSPPFETPLHTCITFTPPATQDATGADFAKRPQLISAMDGSLVGWVTPGTGSPYIRPLSQRMEWSGNAIALDEPSTWDPPAVGTDGQHYVVAWSYCTSTSRPAAIKTAVVSNGKLGTINTLPVGDPDPHYPAAATPSLAFDGTFFGMAFAVGGHDVNFVRLTSDGTLAVDTAQKTVRSAESVISRPRIAYNGSCYGVIWHENLPNDQPVLFFQLLTVDGLPVTAEPLQIDNTYNSPPDSTNSAQIAATNEDFAVAWTSWPMIDGQRQKQPRLALVRSDGTLSSSPIDLGTPGSYGITVAARGDLVAVGWIDPSAHQFQVKTYQSHNGTLIDLNEDNIVVNEVPSSSSLFLSWGSRELSAVWINNESNIYISH